MTRPAWMAQPLPSTLSEAKVRMLLVFSFLCVLCASALSSLLHFLFSNFHFPPSHRPVRKLIRQHPLPHRPRQRMRQRPNQFRILRRTPHRNPDRLRQSHPPQPPDHHTLLPKLIAQRPPPTSGKTRAWPLSTVSTSPKQLPPPPGPFYNTSQPPAPQHAPPGVLSGSDTKTSRSGGFPAPTTAPKTNKNLCAGEKTISPPL